MNKIYEAFNEFKSQYYLEAFTKETIDYMKQETKEKEEQKRRAELARAKEYQEKLEKLEKITAEIERKEV